MIVGDPEGIKNFYAPLLTLGAKAAPQYGDGIYTGTWDFSLTSSFALPKQTPFCFHHSPLQLQHDHLRLCRGEGSQDPPRFV
jgi:hypothetical protein